MSREALLAVARAETCTELREDVVSFAKSLGFDYVCATVVVDHVGSETEFISVHNTPPGYLEMFSDREAGQRDPVMQHCKTHITPIIWDQRTYLDAGAIGAWEEQARFGYKTGIGVALHMPNGKHFSLGVDRDQTLAMDEAELSRTVADLHLFAVYANEAASRILIPPQADVSAPKLAPRELDCLKWTMEGKTAWEIGVILNLAESTVVSYMRNAAKKLQCVNKQHAIARALRLGLVR